MTFAAHFNATADSVLVGWITVEDWKAKPHVALAPTAAAAAVSLFSSLLRQSEHQADHPPGGTYTVDVVDQETHDSHEL